MQKDIFNKKVIPIFTLSLLIATLGVGIGFFIPPVLFIPVMIAELVILLVTFLFKKKIGFPIWLLFLFVLLTGITTAPIVAWVGLEGGSGVVLQALGITTLVFGGLAGYVYVTGKDFRFIGTFLTFALLGLILASMVNIFLKQTLFGLIIDVAVLLVFLGFVMYDMSKILRDYSDNMIGDAALALYLDFLNIFIRILQLLVLSRKRE
ncbi:MAG: Bax inhibitor-1/YccA family protein [Candidatus Woesearchaeota archaeon]